MHSHQAKEKDPKRQRRDAIPAQRETLGIDAYNKREG